MYTVQHMKSGQWEDAYCPADDKDTVEQKKLALQMYQNLVGDRPTRVIDNNGNVVAIGAPSGWLASDKPDIKALEDQWAQPAVRPKP